MWKKSSKNYLRTLLNRKVVKKTKMMQMIWLIRPMLIKIWKCIVEIIFLRLNITSSWIHFQLGSSEQISFNFWGLFIHFSPNKSWRKNTNFFSCGALLLYVLHEVLIEAPLFQGTCCALCACNSHPNFPT